ncbi:MAG: ArnT family glycosyltransferase [Microcystaceae cyanobacterium]
MSLYVAKSDTLDQPVATSNRLHYWGLLPPLCLLVLVLVFMPIGSVFEYNFDEGCEVMWAFLQNQGLLLYKDIWSDQTPVFSQFTRTSLAIFGNSIFHLRLLVLVFAAVLLYFFYETLALFFDRITAIFGTFILAFSRDFIPLAVQVKVDIPSLTFSMASIFFFFKGFYHKDRKFGVLFLILSSLFLELALFSKMYVVIIVFALATYSGVMFLMNLKNRETKKWVVQAFLCWGISLFLFSLVTMVSFYLWLGNDIFDLFIGSHLRAKEYFTLDFTSLIQGAFKSETSLWLLSASGLLILFTKERWRIIFPLLWLVGAIAVLYDHKPAWSHYYLLLAIPMAWIASSVFFWVKQRLTSSYFGSFQSFFNKDKTISFPSVGSRIVTFLAIGLIGMVLFSPILLNLKVIVQGNHPFQKMWGEEIKAEILTNIKGFSDQTNWIATDRAMFAFYADLKVVPELAALPRKRVVTEEFNGSDFLEIIKKYNPEQVLIGRYVEGRFDKPFLNDVALSNYLEEKYQDITIENQKKGGIIHHYVLNSLKDSNS